MSLQLLGYLTQVNQANRVMTLFGHIKSPTEIEYYVSHEYTPGLDIKLGLYQRPLHDRELIKVPGYVCPFYVNLYEGACCHNKGDTLVQ